jgi:hypothetical protein
MGAIKTRAPLVGDSALNASRQAWQIDIGQKLVSFKRDSFKKEEYGYY